MRNTDDVDSDKIEMDTNRIQDPGKANKTIIKEWFDEDSDMVNPLIDEDVGGQLYGLDYRAKPQGEWVNVESVMDSGASAPVAPPTMAPKVPIKASEGSGRGQN